MKLEIKHIALGLGAFLVYKHFKTQFTPTQSTRPSSSGTPPEEPSLAEKALSFFKGDPEKKAAKKASKQAKKTAMAAAPNAKLKGKKAKLAKEKKLGSLLM